MKKVLSIFLAILFTSGLIAQNQQNAKKLKKEEARKRIDEKSKQEEEGVIVYKKQKSFGGKLISNGAAAFYEIGKAQSVKKSLLYQIEIGEQKSQKEEKTSNLFSLSFPFIYGKLNFLYPVKIGVQQQILLGNKSNKNGVSVSANLGGGLIIGLLRPYEVEVDKNGTRKFVSYNSPDSLLFINAYDPSENAAGPNLGTGWNHLKVTPGIYIKPAIRFDYGKLNETVSAIEVGVSADMYAKKIPEMLYNKQNQFFFSAYAAIIFGRRK